MLKLKLENIQRVYQNGERVVALRDVSVGFRQNEFVSILGPSGCGKTTMLNIIGGLDRYDGGDLKIDGLSTKEFRDGDWDAYRNHSIGFVFQNYHLIAHQTVQQNVEIALTLSGVTPSEREKRAARVLKEVGLADKMKKKPNQLSGGQMQRVAIARALVNDPDIILADEPTGALDSQTSIQIMELLKKIAKDKLVIMVTHNTELAEAYSTRIIRLLDGNVLSDSQPTDNENTVQNQDTFRPPFKGTSMSMIAAGLLSFKNLMTKRGRTVTTAFAGSIGIIGIALVLALSSGLTSYMSSMQSDTLSGYPIQVSTTVETMEEHLQSHINGSEREGFEEYPGSSIVYRYQEEADSDEHVNTFSKEYLDYVSRMTAELPDAVNTISYQMGVQMHLMAKAENRTVKFSTEQEDNGQGPMGQRIEAPSTYWQEMPDNEEFILSMYDLIGKNSRLPSSKNEIAIVVDEYNCISEEFFVRLGLPSSDKTYSAEDFIGKTLLKVVEQNDYYTKKGNVFTEAITEEYDSLFQDKNGVPLKVVGVIRVKEDIDRPFFSDGFIYTSALAEYVARQASNSDIVKAQKNSKLDVLTGAEFANSDMRQARLLEMGADDTPLGISIYPMDFDAKDEIKAYLDVYNKGKAKELQVEYTDMAESISGMAGSLVEIVSYVLIGFAAISLLVSTIMIGIITYVSVIERTKEIGILRSVGARKKDISRVFNAETFIIGFAAGVIGVGISLIVIIPINAIIFSLTEIEGVASMQVLHVVLLIAGSMVLTFIAGFFPARMAAKKDPVEALRTE